MKKEYDVIGLGNALMDLLVEINHDKFLEFDLKHGEMHLVNETKAKEILDKINNEKLTIETIPGGSAANTIKCIAFLGGKSILCGKVGKDKHGEIYIQEMNNYKVSTRINQNNSITGHALTLITPDSERTFSVHLGAAIELKKEDVLEEDIKKSKILHLEGYQIEGPTKETILHAIKLAKKHNTLVSIDLADPGLIRRNKDFLKELVMNSADIVFLNQNEAKEFTGLEHNAALQEISKHTQITIIKLGKKGAVISHKNQLFKIPPVPTTVIDTTGAGDSFAAGFLYGFCNKWDIEKCGKLGSLLAAKIIACKGTKYCELNIDEIKKQINIE